jgi:hypothetical protein
MAPRLVRFGVRPRKLSNVGQSLGGWPCVIHEEGLYPSSEGINRLMMMILFKKVLIPIVSYFEIRSHIIIKRAIYSVVYPMAYTDKVSTKA